MKNAETLMRTTSLATWNMGNPPFINFFMIEVYKLIHTGADKILISHAVYAHGVCTGSDGPGMRSWGQSRVLDKDVVAAVKKVDSMLGISSKGAVDKALNIIMIQDAIEVLDQCLEAVTGWMWIKFLKLNSERTEILCVSSSPF